MLCQPIHVLNDASMPIEADDKFEMNKVSDEETASLSARSSLINPSRHKREESFLVPKQRWWIIYVLISLVVIALVIGLSIGIVMKRELESNEIESTKPSAYPSSYPSISSRPTQQPSYLPSLSNQPSTSQAPSSYPSNKPSISMQPTLRPSSHPSSQPSDRPSNSPTNTVPHFIPNVSTLNNQIIVGYQGWFSYPGDGAPINKWKHWFSTSTNGDATIENVDIDMYPLMDEYDERDLEVSNIKLNNGELAKFYSNWKFRTVLKHFEWMEEYGISGVFHMRFMENIDKHKNHDWKTKVLHNVRRAAQHTGRVFAVSYNIAGRSLNDSVLDDLKNDWIRLVDNEKITESGRYLRHNGRPVLRIYGIGFVDVNVSDTSRLAELIEWFKNGADPKYRVFLIGGVPTGWRERVHDARSEEEWTTIYQSLDGIHPWHVGRFATLNGFDTYFRNIIAKDAELCNELGILYMPTMYPGFSWHNLNKNYQSKNIERREEGTLQMVPPINSIPRLGGKFMWSQAYKYASDPNINTIWMAQFDEVDEGTAIFKVAKNVPNEGQWLTLDIDGLQLPSDWYLRLCGQAQQMMFGNIELSESIPIEP
eukprot:g13778.t1 g13778   contig9:413217-414998(+)